MLGIGIKAASALSGSATVTGPEIRTRINEYNCLETTSTRKRREYIEGLLMYAAYEYSGVTFQEML